MSSNVNSARADPAVVQAWITGWTLARETPPPVHIDGGFRVDVGWPQQRARYVFSRCSPELQRLAETIVEPLVFLKVCASPAQVRPLLQLRWILQPLGFMMTCAKSRSTGTPSLPQGYRLEAQQALAVPVARVLTAAGDVAAIGRVAMVGDYAVYDRIETHPNHRRRGLASVVVNALENVAQSHGTTTGILVATQEGRALYESLGWQLYSLYTTAVIPGEVD